MKTILWILIAVVLAVGGYVGYTRWFGPTERSLQLVTAPVTRGDVVESVDATGRLEAVTTVQVGSQVSGTIKTLNADFNSRVRRGQVIAELDPSLFRSQVEQAQATVVRLQAEVDRARVQYDDTQVKLTRSRDLVARQLVPATDLETAEANFKAADAALKAAEAQVVQAQASLNQARVNLGYTVIAAPIDGVVISRNVDVGQTVAASMTAPTLFQIANDLTQMRVNANIDESDIGMVMAGQPATFRVDAFPNERFTGTVSQVRLNPVIESNVVSYVTVIDVPNPDLRLRPGMTANVTVEVARASNVLRVPASALRFSPTPEVFASLGQPVPETTAGPGGQTAGGAREGAPALSDAERQAFRDRLAQMTPEERQAALAARGGGARNGGGGRNGGRRNGGGAPGVAGGAGAGAAPRAGGPGTGTRGQVWALVDGQLQQVPVRTGISDGANVAVLGGALQEGVAVATGAIEATAAVAAPAAGSPLLPQFGRRGGGAGRGGQGGGAQGGQGGARGGGQ